MTGYDNNPLIYSLLIIKEKDAKTIDFGSVLHGCDSTGRE
jgi:hypothetical protein